MVSRKFQILCTIVVLIAVFGIASFVFSRRARASSQGHSAAQMASTPAPALGNNPPARELPPGTISYIPKANTLSISVARKYLTESEYMTVAEFDAAIRKANNGKSSFKKNEEVLDRFLAKPKVRALYPTEETTRRYAEVYAQLRKQGTPIPTNDMWIAALVLEHDLTLYARDAHFDHLPQIKRA